MCFRLKRLRGSISVCAQLDHSQANAHHGRGDRADAGRGRLRRPTPTSLRPHGRSARRARSAGVLVLLAVGDHQRRIEVGYGLEGILPDGKLGDIGRAMVPDLRAGDYDGAVTQAVDQIAQVIATDANVTLNEEPAAAPAPRPSIAWAVAVQADSYPRCGGVLPSPHPGRLGALRVVGHWALRRPRRLWRRGWFWWWRRWRLGL